MKYAIKGRLTLEGPNGDITWEDYYREVEAKDSNEAKQLFVDVDSAVDEALSRPDRRTDRDELRKAILPVLTLAIRGKYIALPVSMRDALREAYYSKEAK